MIGVITGFASICVNGIEVHFDATTPVAADGQAVSARALAVGQVVSVHAVGLGDQLAARSISVMHAAVGPVSRVEHATGRLQVLGQTVLVAAPNTLGKIRTGDWVRVSGHRLAASGDIAASRLESIAPQAEVSLMGLASHVSAQGFRVNGAAVRMANAAPPPVASGAEVNVRGRWDGQVLHAQQVGMAHEQRRQAPRDPGGL